MVCLVEALAVPSGGEGAAANLLVGRVRAGLLCVGVSCVPRRGGAPALYARWCLLRPGVPAGAYLAAPPRGEPEKER